MPNEKITRCDPATMRALSHAKRVEILEYLERKKEATAKGLAEAIDNLTPGQAVYHLRVLSEAGMVARVKTLQVKGVSERVYAAK